MEFKNLPDDVQKIAAETLKLCLLDSLTVKEEPGEELALMVRKAFLTLYQSVT